MTEILAKTADSLILRFALRKHEFLLHGERVTMQELDTELAFSRKPASLADMGGGALERVFIFDQVEMDASGFDALARTLSRDQHWLVGRSVSAHHGSAGLCDGDQSQPPDSVCGHPGQWVCALCSAIGVSA